MQFFMKLLHYYYNMLLSWSGKSRILYHVISQHKTNLLLSLTYSVEYLENAVKLKGHSAQEQRLGVKIAGFLPS